MTCELWNTKTHAFSATRSSGNHSAGRSQNNVPTAAVAGWYFAHSDARYFGIGKIGRDQVLDYARRKGMSVQQAERWLSPVLAYDP